MTIAPGTRLGPYEIQSSLGRGGMGEVYRARDERLGRFVALKCLRGDALGSPGAIERFLREARTASALNHPNIVTIHDVGETDAGRFIAMELIEGRTIRELLREPPSIERVVSIGMQVARALAAAHAAGIIHRDLKPENIMVRPDGYVKVLDFGLARIDHDNTNVNGVAETALTDLGMVMGTLKYLSPEQARADAITQSSDIFALGIVLYEVATANHPFAAHSNLAIASAIISHTPVPPARVNPQIPAPLESLLLDMLEKAPTLRPTAIEVERRLLEMSGGHSLAAATTAVRRRQNLVGRDQPLAELEASVRAVMAEGGLVHAIAADPGLGKTSVVNTFLEGVQASRLCRIGRGRCSERLAGAEAYLPLLEALEQLLRGESGDEVARAMSSLAPDWYAQIHRSPSSTLRSTTDIGAGSYEQMKRQLNVLLAELTRVKPLVLFLDDVHWADASTMDLVAYLADRFDALRVLLVVTYRPSDLRDTHTFAQVKLHVSSRQAYRETLLTPLSRQDIEQHLAVAYPGHTFPGEFVTLLHDRTEGVPLFMVDLMRQFVDQGVVVETDGVWRLEASVERLKPEMPASVRSAIKRTVDRLDEADRRVLVAASVQGAEFDSAVVAAALGATPEEVEERLERLERVSSVIRLVDERELSKRTPSLRYAFTHNYYQNAFYETLRASRRVSASGATAAAIIRYYGQHGPMSSRLAVLYEAAHDFEAAASQFLIAAHRASNVFAGRETVVLARRGLEAVTQLEESPNRDRLELQLRVAVGMALTGLVGYAAADVETEYTRARELGDRLGDTPALVPVLHGIYRYFIVRGRLQTARDVVRQILTLAQQTGDPTHMMVARAAMGPPLVHMGELEAAVSHLRAAVAVHDPRTHASLRTAYTADIGITLRLWLALALWLQGRVDEATEFNRTAVTMAQQFPAPFGLAYTHALTAWFHQYRGDVDAVQRHAAAAVAIAREHEFPQWLALGLMFQAWAQAASGEPDAAINSLRGGIERFRQTGAELNMPHFLGLLADAQLRAWQGAQGLDTIEHALGYVAVDGDRCFEPELYRLKGALLLSDGFTRSRPAAAAAFVQACAVADRQGSHMFGLRAAVDHARLLILEQRRTDARKVVEPRLRMFPDDLKTPEIESARRLVSDLA